MQEKQGAHHPLLSNSCPKMMWAFFRKITPVLNILINDNFYCTFKPSHNLYTSGEQGDL